MLEFLFLQISQIMDCFTICICIAPHHALTVMILKMLLSEYSNKCKEKLAIQSDKPHCLTMACTCNSLLTASYV